MTDREKRAWCEKIIKDEHCYACKGDSSFNCWIMEERGSCGTKESLVLFAHQWLIDNPKEPKIPKWDELPKMLLDGEVVYIAYDTGAGYRYVDKKMCSNVVRYDRFTPYIETKTMEIPIDKVKQVEEIINK